ncbi:MAG: hypoxanthine phosphoribosyltransferase, partial [Cyanobacteria bacterium REEB65]|nr:hypoxanthine phosphoribosyltransferase [Cyanobacteria bacterium REEB65]
MTTQQTSPQAPESPLLAHIDHTLFSAEQLAGRVTELGVQISHDYHGQDLLLVGVLRGVAVFLGDL